MIVEDIMTMNVWTLTPSDTIRNALTLISEKRIRHIPLVSKDRNLVGLVTERDIKDAAPSSLQGEEMNHIMDQPLEAIMKTDIITGHPLDFVEEAACIFYDNRIGCLPIVSDGKLVGILTGTDLLHTMVELTGANQPGSQIEIRVQNKTGALFDAAAVFRKHQVNIQSVLVYPDKNDPGYKILVFRVGTMNPVQMIESLKKDGLHVLWPNMPGMEL